MSLSSELSEEQLFDQLISTLVHSAWVALGYTKDPVSNEVQKNLKQAAVQIDMLDMLFKRMDGNLSPKEEEYVSQLLHELKHRFAHLTDQNQHTGTASSSPNGTA